MYSFGAYWRRETVRPLESTSDRELAEILRREGFEAFHRRVVYSPDILAPITDLLGFIFDRPWTIVVSVPLIPFLNSFMSKAGEDAYSQVKSLLSRVSSVKQPRQIRGSGTLAPSRRRRLLLLEDPTLSIALELPQDLSDEALRQLLTLDVMRKLALLEGSHEASRFARRRVLAWDIDKGEWVMKWQFEWNSDVPRVVVKQEP
jgi:hypothetical protein